MARAPGVGPKLAARVLNELKDEVSAMAETPPIAVPARPRGAATFRRSRMPLPPWWIWAMLPPTRSGRPNPAANRLGGIETLIPRR